MARQLIRPGGRRGRIRPAGVRRRLIVAFVLVAAVSAGALAAASYLLVRQARLHGSLATKTVQAKEDLILAASIPQREAGGFVSGYERLGAHAVMIFAGGGRVVSDPRVNPPIDPELRRLVRHGMLGYQRISVRGLPYLVLAGRPPRSSAVARASEAARLMAGGRLDTRLPAGAADEFGVWAAAFNEMAEALEAKIAALSAAQERELRFTANVAHELRTPLTALVAEASLLSGHVSELPAAARRPVELLIADVGRLRTLVDELMEISRLDAKSEPVQRQQVDVRSLVTALISARGWEERVTVDGEPLTLTTDPRRVERILANLVGNAVEHGGRDVRVRTCTDGAVGRVDVADAGPGIRPEHLPHVFERFYKADSARASPGSGLGLAIAFENARLLGGNLGVSSQVERGSVFRLTLPLGPTSDVSER